jgi:hypothetical protein
MDSNRKKGNVFVCRIIRQDEKKRGRNRLAERRDRTIPGTGPKDPEQLARTAVQAKEQSCSDFSPFLLPVSSPVS